MSLRVCVRVCVYVRALCMRACVLCLRECGLCARVGGRVIRFMTPPDTFFFFFNLIYDIRCQPQT